MWPEKLNTPTLFSLAAIYTPSLAFKENVSVLVYKKTSGNQLSVLQSQSLLQVVPYF